MDSSSPNSKGRLESKDLPSLRQLGRDLTGFVYETTWKGNTYLRKDFPIGADEHNSIFEREVTSLLDLNHPNIVKCYGYTLGRSCCSLLQEFVDDNIQDVIRRRKEAQMKTTYLLTSKGQEKESTAASNEASSSDMLRSRTTPTAVPDQGVVISSSEAKDRVKTQTINTLPFELSEAEDITLQIASGIEYLHEHEVAHADLKPKSVLVCLNPDAIDSGKMTVKVADFDLAQTKSWIKLVSKRARLFETLMWKAPELFGPDYSGESDDDEVEAKVDDEEIQTSVPFLKSRLAMADVYSFGLTCAYIWGGKLLYPELSLTELRKQRIGGFRPELRNSTCPEYIKHIVDSCLEFDPSERPTFSTICSILDLYRSSPESFDVMKAHKMKDMIASTTTLRLEDCFDESTGEFHYLTELPRRLHKFTSLKTLSVGKCQRLEHLPDEIGDLTSLTTLKLQGCSKLKGLPRSIGDLKALQSLTLDDCGALEQLPDEMGNLTSLTTLKIMGCSKLKGLPRSIGDLKALQTLTLYYCGALEQLPDEMGNLTSLTTLEIRGCSNLKGLPLSIGDLKALQSLILDDCVALEQLPDEMGNLTSLTTLKITGCSNLKGLPRSIGDLKALKIFYEI